MPDTYLVIAQRIAQANAKQDAAALKRLMRAYARMYARLGGQIEALAEKVGDGAMTTGQLARLSQWQSLRGQIEAELSDYGAYVKGELSNSAQDAIDRALKDSRSLISAGSGGRITAGFGTLNSAQVEQLLQFIAPNSMLYKRLSKMPGVVAKDFVKTFIKGVGLGWNPRKIVKMMDIKAGRALIDALRMVRTAQIYTYRETSRASYIESGVVDQWVWLSALGPNTCMTCIVKHGSIHPSTEILNDHLNGPCAMLPLVKGYGNPIKETGEQWFMKQSEADQIEHMGPEYHAAWKAGKYELKNIPHEVENDVYGPMWQVRTLGDLLGE